MRPEDYDAWYRTPRGAWIGETEYRLLWNLLAPRPGERLLDVDAVRVTSPGDLRRGFRNGPR